MVTLLRGLLRRRLLGLLALAVAILPPALAAQGREATVSAAPGTLVRWTAPGTKRCSMKERSWAALRGTCYYPVDLEQKAGVITLALWGSGAKEFARMTVEPFDYGIEEVSLPDIPQANPSAEDLKRDAGDQALLGKVWKYKEGPAQFTLPLGPPARPLPTGKSFGMNRIFNGKRASQLHTGSDYLTPLGTPVLAVADGTVVVAEDL
ncbi:MAG TPA: hypothetical protein VKU44_11515, partial [Terriglobia bacterium]|nr:hypothetical protein [Terriglobia bacterium]